MDKNVAPLHDLTKSQLRLDADDQGVKPPSSGSPNTSATPILHGGYLGNEKPQEKKAPLQPITNSPVTPQAQPQSSQSSAATSPKPLENTSKTVEQPEKSTNEKIVAKLPKATIPGQTVSEGGAVASNIGLSEYRLTSTQNTQIVGMLIALGVLGGMLALIVAGVIAYQIYKSKQYSVVTHNQYKSLASLVIVALVVNGFMFAVLFISSSFFRIKVSGYYMLTLLLTMLAMALLTYARASYFNYLADRQTAKK